MQFLHEHKDSNQSVQMRRLIRIFIGHTSVGVLSHVEYEYLLDNLKKNEVF